MYRIGGDEEARSSGSVESPLKYQSCVTGILTREADLVREQCQAGSLAGAVASQRVTEAPKGCLIVVGNHSKSVKVEGKLTVRPASGAGTKVGLSDPAVRMESPSLNG